MFTEKQLKGILKNADILDEKEFKKIKKEAKKKGKDLQDYLFIKKVITPDNLYQNAANYFKIPFVNLKNKVISKEILEKIPEAIANTHNLVAFEGNDKILKVAVLDPEDLETFEFIKKRFNVDLKVHLTTPDGIKEVLKNYQKSLKSEFKYLSDKNAKGDESGDQKSLKKMAGDAPVIKIVDTLLKHAIMEGASDIHIEPEEKDVLVRYRIDGVLTSVMTLPKHIQSGIISRIKILSNLKVDEHRLPQDGRFKIASERYKVAFRVSIIPIFDGEKIVMRLLNEKAQTLTLEDLGFQPKPFDVVKRNISRPHGIILVSGPTGSGKTTTLYTVLNLLNTPDVNIATVEDPIEYRMKGVNQSQVNSKIGFTFAAGLRSLLRQDPDIIMVGEIRDEETAEIAVHAAMTGHLVLSTIHTNDAATTMPRLAKMGVPSFLISSTFNVIIAQRLVRRICKHCIQSYTLDQKAIKELEKELDFGHILDVLEKEKVVLDAKKSIDNLLFYKGKGCDKCNNTGYKGRIGIYEVLENNDQVSKLILERAGAEKINNQAINDGMLTIMEDGFIKAKNGITTIEEVLRVTKE